MLTNFYFGMNLTEVSEAEMDECDNQLRVIMKKLWPYFEQSKFDLCVPHKHELHGEPGKRIISVGKIYAALLMVGNYRNYKETLEKENVTD